MERLFFANSSVQGLLLLRNDFFLPRVKGCCFKHLVLFPYIRRAILSGGSIILSFWEDYR